MDGRSICLRLSSLVFVFRLLSLARLSIRRTFLSPIA